MNLHHSSMFVGIALALSLVSSTTGAPATDLPSTPLTGRYDDLQLPIYASPKNVLPRARVGGALRGKDSADVEIVALVPDHIGLTVNKPRRSIGICQNPRPIRCALRSITPTKSTRSMKDLFRLRRKPACTPSI